MQSRGVRLTLSQLLPMLFCLLAALPTGAIGILLIAQVRDRELQIVHDQHVQLARYLVGALARYAEDVESTFHMAASNIAEKRPVNELATVLQRLHFKHVCIVNDTGHVESFLAPGMHLQLKQVPPALMTALQNGAAWTVAPDLHGQPTIFLWHQLRDKLYALGALRTDYLVALQSTIAFGQKGHAVIVDRRGRVIAHPKAEWQATMHDIAALEPVRRMIAGETGVAQFFSPAMQAPMVAGFSTVPSVGWGVMIPQPLEELEAHVEGVKQAVRTVIGVAFLGTMVLGLLASRWLTAPLRYIGAAAQRFADGMFTTRVHNIGRFPGREVVALAQQFNTMADEVNRSAEARQQSEQRFRAFAEIAADGFWETDTQQIFTYLAPPPTTRASRHPHALLGRHRREVIVGDPEGKVVATIQHYMDRGEAFENVVFQVLGSNDQPIYVSVAGRPICDAAKRIVGYRGVARDITTHLQVQERLRQADIEERLRQKQKMEAIGTLAGGVAHDFNNILGIILGFTDLSLSTVSQGSLVWRNLQEVLKAARRAQGLVQQILTFSRKETGERKPLLLHREVQEVLRLLRASFPATITIHQEQVQDVGAILADAIQIQQVLMNLCTNAEYAMRPAGGVLEICLDMLQVEADFAMDHPPLQAGPHARLRVRDTGHGIAAPVLSRIFDPFFTTKPVGQGTGMGLAVVHGIITSHGGAITVHSQVGEGTTLTVYFPSFAAPSHEAEPAAESVTQGHGTVLFVDDEESLVEVGRGMLEHLGYHVVGSTSSIHAVELFQADPAQFDLIITDQTMPQMTGEALARAVRAIRADIPIVLCTGFSHSIDADKAAAQKIDAFLLKPLTIRDLGLTIQRVVAQRNGRMVEP